jgi:hypothetical protein
VQQLVPELGWLSSGTVWGLELRLLDKMVGKQLQPVGTWVAVEVEVGPLVLAGKLAGLLEQEWLGAEELEPAGTGVGVVRVPELLGVVERGQLGNRSALAVLQPVPALGLE